MVHRPKASTWCSSTREGGLRWWENGCRKDRIGRGPLTPMHRLRQLEPSWLRSGQTTSLLASVMEKDEVREDLGGMLQTPPFDVEGLLIVGGGGGD